MHMIQVLSNDGAKNGSGVVDLVWRAMTATKRMAENCGYFKKNVKKELRSCDQNRPLNFEYLFSYLIIFTEDNIG